MNKQQGFKFAIGERLMELSTSNSFKVLDHVYYESIDTWFYKLASIQDSAEAELSVKEVEEQFLLHQSSFRIVGKKTDIQPHWETYYQYLEQLRSSGDVNMFAAAQPLYQEYYMEIDLEQAVTIINNWMRNYEELSKMYGWKSSTPFDEFN